MYDLVTRSRVDLDATVTGHFGLDDVEKALMQDADPHAMQAIVRPVGA